MVDANRLHSSLYHLHLPIINIEDIDAHLKDKPKINLPGFISNPFVLFWSIYYSSYANNKQTNIMKTLFIVLLPICVSILVAELLIFIGKGIIFISHIIANRNGEVNFKGNIIIAILSFIITFLMLQTL